MSRITHTTLLFSDLSKLNEIPSEFIEPYLITFFEYIIEAVGTGWKTVNDAKAELKGVESFVSLFCGIHSRIAIMKEYYKIKNMPEDEFLLICKQCCT